MKHSFKKRGQKAIRRFSRASAQASEDSKDHIRENFIERLSHIRNIRLLVLEWLLLAIALIMLAIAQSFWFKNSYSTTTFTSGGTYIEGTVGDINSLNPLFATTSSEKTLSRLMFATLASNDYSGHSNANLAKSITSSTDGRIWTVTLRDGLKWSDGEPITNSDVLFTIRLITNTAVNSVYDSNLANVQVSENEQGEIVFTLSGAYADFISALNIPIVPEHILASADPQTLIENSFSLAPVTSGAFNFNAIQTTSSGDKIIYLSANPAYFKGKPLLNNFAVHTFDSQKDLVAALNSDAITGTAELSESDAKLITSPTIRYKNTSIDSGAYIFFNTARVASRDLRQAIRQGVNIDELRSIAPNNAALDYPILASQIPIATYPEIPSYDPTSSTERIAALTGGETITLNLATVDSGYFPALANNLAEQLQSLGFNINLSIYEENQDFITNVIANRAYDILVYEIELGSDPDPLPYYHSSQATAAGLNLSNYKNTIVNDLLVGGRSTLNTNLRAAKYETFLEHWVEDVPAIGIYQSNLTYFYNKNARAFGDDVKLSTKLDRFVDITSWSTIQTTKNRTP